jgi:anaerobic selenocysteine-containing dehydrogenase
MRVQSICRVCHNACPILVDVDTNGRPTHVTGDPASESHHGFTCVKGRAIPEIENSPTRLLRSLKRTSNGSHVSLTAEHAMDEIAEQLQAIIDQHGPRSVAIYAGTKLTQNPAAYPMSEAFMDAIGSRMRFTANTIDQPGKAIAKGLHGSWMAPPQGHDAPECVLFIGVNGLVTFSGMPTGDPGRFVKSVHDRGGSIIVIDPRQTQLARRAAIHLQIRAGEDAAVLAGLLRVIITENLHDAAFVADNVDGFNELRHTIEPFTPDVVAARADIEASALVAAARLFARARRGYALAGTGTNTGTGHGTLCEYLVLALDTVCGHYLRAGERVRNPGTLIAPMQAKAQASPPSKAYGFGKPLRVRGLQNTLAGLQTAALPEEILMPGEGQVRALIVLGGNPVAAWPDQLMTIEAMKSLDLLVTLDVELSQTSKLAHYVIAPTMSLEVPGFTQLAEMLPYSANGAGGFADAAGQYTPIVATRPDGSDLIEEWEFFYGIAQRLSLPLRMKAPFSFIPGSPGPVEIDMVHKPTTEHLLDLLTAGSRVPLDELRRNPGNSRYPDATAVVASKDDGWEGRLHVGNAELMADLVALAMQPHTCAEDAFEFRVLSRRLMHVLNSSHNIAATNRGRSHNVAFCHPDDLLRLGIADGDLVEITSARSTIVAVAGCDSGLRPGDISIAHAFGGGPDGDADVRTTGSPTNRLLSVSDCYDRYSGQPLMSNIPARLRRLDDDAYDYSSIQS